jgi:hypothetical protein
VRRASEYCQLSEYQRRGMLRTIRLLYSLTFVVNVIRKSGACFHLESGCVKFVLAHITTVVRHIC